MSLEKDKNQAELEKTLEKASLYMTNMRAKDGLQWDGVRVESRGLSVEQLEHKVWCCCCCCCWWWWCRCSCVVAEGPHDVAVTAAVARMFLVLLYCRCCCC